MVILHRAVEEQSLGGLIKGGRQTNLIELDLERLQHVLVGQPNPYDGPGHETVDPDLHVRGLAVGVDSGRNGRDTRRRAFQAALRPGDGFPIGRKRPPFPDSPRILFSSTLMGFPCSFETLGMMTSPKVAEGTLMRIWPTFCTVSICLMAEVACTPSCWNSALNAVLMAAAITIALACEAV